MSNPRREHGEERARPLDGLKDVDLTKREELDRVLEQLPPHPSVEGDWHRVLPLIPVELEATAQDSKALERRREVRGAADLLRLVLAYALCDWPLRIVALWACVIGLADLSDVALRKRLRRTKTWMGVLVAALLLTTHSELAGRPVRLRLVDATALSQPGSKGTDWRVHLSVDLSQMGIDGVEITDAHGGETLARYPVRAGDILVADRAYCRQGGIGRALSRGGAVVVRTGWQSLILRVEGGQKLDLFEWLRQVPLTEPAEREVTIQTAEGDYSLRLIARRLSQEAADRAKQQLRRQASKKGHTLDRRTLEAAGFILLVTNLDSVPWTAPRVLALYRLRWQVETFFKRLKGVLCLDGLRAKDPALVQVYLLGKLLGAMLASRLSRGGPVECAEWLASVERPVSPWRWLQLWADVLRSAVRGALSLTNLLATLPRLRRYLCDTPRRRRQQCAFARCLARLLGQAPPTSQHVAHANPFLLQPTNA